MGSTQSTWGEACSRISKIAPIMNFLLDLVVFCVAGAVAKKREKFPSGIAERASFRRDMFDLSKDLGFLNAEREERDSKKKFDSCTKDEDCGPIGESSLVCDKTASIDHTYFQAGPPYPDCVTADKTGCCVVSDAYLGRKEAIPNHPKWGPDYIIEPPPMASPSPSATTADE